VSQASLARMVRSSFRFHFLNSGGSSEMSEVMEISFLIVETALQKLPNAEWAVVVLALWL
jgi:hypothetical protein